MTQHVQVHLTCVNSAKFRELKLAWDIMHKIGLTRKMLCYMSHSDKKLNKLLLEDKGSVK